MLTPLHVLIVADQAPDAELLMNALRSAGFDPTWQRAASEAAYLAHLAAPLDLILAEYALPAFDAMRALQLLRVHQLDIPLIVVTESISEQDAVECIKLGAADYLLKDRLARLGSAVRQALMQQELCSYKRMAEAALQASEARFRAVFQSAALGIAIVDLHGQLMMTNPVFQELLGYTQDELCGQPFVAYTHPDEAASSLARFNALVAGERGRYQTEKRYVQKSGQLLWARLSVALAPCADDAPQFVIVTVEDITTRKQADAVRAQLAAIVDCTDDAIVGTMLDGTIASWNAGAQRIYGYAPEEVIGQPVAILSPPARQHEVAQLLDRLRRGERITHYETVRTRKAGQLIDVALTISPIMDDRGSITGFSTIARDMSERKRAEQALRRQTTFVHLLQVVATAANQVSSIETALQAAVDQVCAHIGWPVGHVYLARDGDPYALSSTDIWHLDDPTLFATFRAVTEATGFAPTDDLPVQVLISGQPEWIADLTLAPSAPRARLISDIGVRAGFAFPVLVGAEVAAVLEFFATEAIEPDAALLEVMRHIGEQLGRVVERVRVAAALRESEERFRILFEHSPDAIMLIDPHHRHISWPIVDCNDLACQMNGYTRTELIGHTIDVLHDDAADPAERIAYLARLRREGTIQIEAIHRRKDGSLFPIEAVSSLITIAGRELLLGIDRDITDRKQAEAALREAEQRYRDLFEEAPVMYVITDNQAGMPIITDCNAEFSKTLGYPRAELLDRPLADFYTPNSRDRLAAGGYEQALAGTFSDQERELVRCDGRVIQTLLRAIPEPASDGQVIGTRAMYIDITERKRAETALAEERALLARRVDERTADLSAANAELARGARLKDEFLASMSHELRTPLNAVLGLSEALQEEIYGPLTEQQRRSLHSIEESGCHLLGLINDILDLAKVGSGTLELELVPLSVATICQASIRLIRQDAHKKHVSVDLAIDPAVRLLLADARRLKQILVNLLSNAVKFTPVGGAIGLEVTGDATGQVVYLTVWDTGIGIAPDDLGRLFQPFVQLDSRLSRQYNGTGLGLALVCRMVEMHGGSVSVTSEPGCGSSFTVALPWQLPDDSVEPISPPSAATSAGAIRTALIIEDSPTAAAQLVRYLDELGVTAITSPHGADAVALALEKQPDLIALDILLPDTLGWEVLQRLKAEPRTAAIPVLIVSVIDDRAYGLTHGAADYLVKPLTRQAVQQALHNLARMEPDGTRAGAAAAPAMPPVRPTVLLAEDSESNITTVSDYLSAKGYQVVVARNGAEAVTQARAIVPAMILMDIQMPGMDGLEATRCIRAQPDLVRIPIIALTALAMPGDRERCLAAGANDYLSKPVSLKGLAAALATYLQ
jgi:PAS domain S-box-containing protein